MQNLIFTRQLILNKFFLRRLILHLNINNPTFIVIINTLSAIKSM
ncbi:hypothetical protein HMPREF0880_04347 [Yokenella regensburgei ATCC 43003]|nr:hypothetical protein HMPREF0880_04347 [Yokenella regensburgei ATCC 43003]